MMGVFAFSSVSANSARWVTILADASIKGMAILLMAVVVRIIMRRASAASRHLVWCLALGSLLALPVVSVLLPIWQVAILPPMQPAGGTQVKTNPPESAPSTRAPETPRVPGPWTVRAPAVPESAPPEMLVAHGLSQNGPLPEPPKPEPVLQPSEMHRKVPPTYAGAGTQPIHWSAWIFTIWLIGALAILSRLLTGTMRVWRMARRTERITEDSGTPLLRTLSRELGLAGRIALLQSRKENVPMTWGLLRPTVLLPADAANWSADRLRIVLLHELAHVKRRDCLTQMLAQLACAMHWFNPLAWLAAQQSRVERERACDDYVLGSGSKPSEYAGHLLEIVRSLHATRRPSFAALPIARPSGIEKRMRAILDASRNRRSLTRLAIVLTLLPAACVTVLLGITRLVATGQDEARQTEAGIAQPAVVRAGEPSREPDSEMLVTPLVSIGKVRFGMSEEEVLKILGKPDKRQPRCLIYRPLGLTVGIHPTVGVTSFDFFTRKAIPWWDAVYTKDF